MWLANALDVYNSVESRIIIENQSKLMPGKIESNSLNNWTYHMLYEHFAFHGDTEDIYMSILSDTFFVFT